jgi:hypothetical protein
LIALLAKAGGGRLQNFFFPEGMLALLPWSFPWCHPLALTGFGRAVQAAEIDEE